MPTFDKATALSWRVRFRRWCSGIAFADAEGSALLLEKMPDPGGISITAGGGIRISETAEAAFEYIRAGNAGRTPDGTFVPSRMGWVADGLV